MGARGVRRGSWTTLNARRPDPRGDEELWAALEDQARETLKLLGSLGLGVLLLQPFSQAGPNSVGNGLLLRSDLHKLFDKGYITVDATDQVVLISPRIREEFSNGKEYYRFDKQPLQVLPKLIADQPDAHTAVPVQSWPPHCPYTGAVAPLAGALVVDVPLEPEFLFFASGLICGSLGK